MTDPGHRSLAVTHTTRNPRGPFVSVSLNFPFRDFFLNFSSFPKQTLQKDFVTSDTGPETPHPSLILGQPHPIGHEDFIAATVVPGASACTVTLGSLFSLSHPTGLSHGGNGAAPAMWLHELVHLQMGCTVNYFSGTSGPPGTAR